MDTTAVSTDNAIEPSVGNALPHYLPIAVFPLIFAAAAFGGWWIVATIVFLVIAAPLDLVFGTDSRNMKLQPIKEKQLIWYNLPVWGWAFLWPLAFVFTLWQIFVVGNLAIWESVLMALILAAEGQAVFIVGHEMVHRRARWERYVAEFLLASVSYPHYATEHFYIHHANVGTPLDVGSAPKGQSIWQYFPRELISNITQAWIVVRKRMARRRTPIWHYSNPFWRYGIETAIWYLFVFLLGGWLAVLIYMILCLGIVFSMKVSNYLQHYGLRRIRLPNGRFEKVQPRHSWSANYKLSKWMFFNMQRHPDHHVVANRMYPLLQHYGEDESPHLPGSYGQMFNLVLRPKLWFETIDPLVDKWRAQFYPQIEDWNVYDSHVSEARPEAFETIDEIFRTAPRLAKVIERNPDLLDSLSQKEFTGLDIPGGFGQDSTAEKIARSGLVRVYWLHEFGLAEMQEQLAELPSKDAIDAAEMVRNWSNDKAFQIGMHTLRGSLTPLEAAEALSNLAQASVRSVLSAAESDSSERHKLAGNNAVAALVSGDLASDEFAPRSTLEIRFIYIGDATKNIQAWCRIASKALEHLTEDSVLFEKSSTAISVTELHTLDQINTSAADLLNFTRTKCIYTGGNSSIEQRLNDLHRTILTDPVGRDKLIDELCKANELATVNQTSLFDTMVVGLKHLERCALLLRVSQLSTLSPNQLSFNAIDIFREAKEQELIAGQLADELIKATELLRNLHGMRRLIITDEVTAESTPESVRVKFLEVCNQSDFSALKHVVEQSATVAETGFTKIYDR